MQNSPRSYSAEVPFRLDNSDIPGSHESLTVVVRVRGSAFLAFPLIVASVAQTQGKGGRRVGQGALGYIRIPSVAFTCVASRLYVLCAC
jgi:hypothetical protein